MLALTRKSAGQMVGFTLDAGNEMTIRLVGKLLVSVKQREQCCGAIKDTSPAGEDIVGDLAGITGTSPLLAVCGEKSMEFLLAGEGTCSPQQSA